MSRALHDAKQDNCLQSFGGIKEGIKINHAARVPRCGQKI